MKKLVDIGPKPNVIQIVPPRDAMRPSVRRASDPNEMHDLVVHPLASPTGPGGAKGFRNRAGSTITTPQVMNIYLGQFWGDQRFVEGFSKAIVENGYLDPLQELGYGTGSGTYLGAAKGPELKPNSVFNDADARNLLKQLLDQGTLHGDENSLFVFILPDKVVSDLGGDKSCQNFCGYHDAIPYNGIDVAYAVLPSPLCKGCGGEIGDFTAVYAHELAEACTDKVPGKGWVADDGQENGDLEAWILFGWGPSTDPNRYTVQGYYTNERGNTVGKWRDETSAATAAGRFAAEPAGCLDPPDATAAVFGCIGHPVDVRTKLKVIFPNDAARQSFCQCVAGAANTNVTEVSCSGENTVQDVIDSISC